jgi:hypothetical protein
VIYKSQNIMVTKLSDSILFANFRIYWSSNYQIPCDATDKGISALYFHSSKLADNFAQVNSDLFMKNFAKHAK